MGAHLEQLLGILRVVLDVAFRPYVHLIRVAFSESVAYCVHLRYALETLARGGSRWHHWSIYGGRGCR